MVDQDGVTKSIISEFIHPRKFGILDLDCANEGPN